MLKSLVLSAAMLISIVKPAKAEDLFFGATGPSGTFGMMMQAHVLDLKDYYNGEFIISGQCYDSNVVPNLEQAGQKGIFARFSTYLAEARVGKYDNIEECQRQPNLDNFVYGYVGYGLMYTRNDTGLTAEDFFNPDKELLIGVNTPMTVAWMEKFLAHHNLPHRIIRYTFSSDVRTGVLSNEIDMGYTNSNQTFWSDTESVSAVFTSNPEREINDGIEVRSVSEFSDFEFANNSTAGVFFAINLTPEEIEVLRKRIRETLLDDESNLAQFLSNTVGQINTLRDINDPKKELELINESIELNASVLRTIND